MSMRESIASIIAKTGGTMATTDAILAALPDMIAPLVWVRLNDPHYYSGEYVLISGSDGYLVDFDDLSLGHGYTLEQAQFAANTHHRAAIMAAFTGETQ
jgi:hypothetical protein